MKRILSLILCLAMAASLAGCAGGNNAQQMTEVVGITKVSPNKDFTVAPCEDFSPATEFGMNLLEQTLAVGDENPVIAPASAYLCLAMVMLGAEGETLAEFEHVMGGDTETATALAHHLTKKLMDTEGSTKLNVANSLWADDDRVTLQKEFVQDIVNYFDGEMYQADLPSKKTLNNINAWVNDKTEGLIPKLHDEPYPADTVLVLLNTLYMKAEWQRMFMGHSTRDKTFTKADGTELTAPFMQMYEENQQYINLDGAEGILLPYDDGKTAFVALRPTGGESARDFAASLTEKRLAGYIGSAEDRLTNFSMPKFNLAYELYLTDALIEMGLKRAFDADADFIPMGSSANGPLYLSWVFQKVKIEVNEEGTEAAAVTEVAATEGAMMPVEEPVNLHLDSPFVYAVVDFETGVPLFIGLLEDPTAE